MDDSVLSIFHVNFLDEAQIFLRLDLPQLKLECLNCQKFDIRANSPCGSILLWTSFLQVSQQKHIEMVSTINKTYSKKIYKPYQQKPSRIVFLIREGEQTPNAEQFVIKLKKAARYQRFSIKRCSLFSHEYCKIFNFAMFMGKYL